MYKSDITTMPEYFDRYIALTKDVSVVDALKISLEELQNAPLDKWRNLGENTYAKGKWTVKDMIQHVIDTERVFAYRITAIARGDKQNMLPFDEEDYGKNALANRRNLEEIVEELILIRKANILLFQSFTNDMLQQDGNSFNGMKYSPLALGFAIVGHQQWHFNVLEERYYPLLK
jgi:hypothetical protein